MEKRIITTDVTEEDFSLEGNLRPQTLDDYIGQEKTKSTLKGLYRGCESRGMMRWIMFCFMVLRGLVRLLFRGLLPMRWGFSMKVTSGGY